MLIYATFFVAVFLRKMSDSYEYILSCKMVQACGMIGIMLDKREKYICRNGKHERAITVKEASYEEYNRREHTFVEIHKKYASQPYQHFCRYSWEV